MNVIRHDDKPPSKPVISCWTIEEERNQPPKYNFIVEDMRTTLHARCQKIRDVSIAVRPHAMQATQTPLRWTCIMGSAV
jgi:hypothetical protein